MTTVPADILNALSELIESTGGFIDIDAPLPVGDFALYPTKK